MKPLKRVVTMKPLKFETIHEFKKIYKEFPELIDYRIEHGNLYERAQATLIKHVALSVSQKPEKARQSSRLQKISVEGSDAL